MHNFLKNETSPYLLQHAENPVNWYPWCKEAFERAKREDKPVFLSIGYSTCHWCHVMAHESFEDEETAEILNRYFISIKVDKEERPDIDSIYMSVCQAFTGSGGWPTTIFLTPDQKPFFAGTYFPRKAKYGQIGLQELLLAVWEKWKTDRKTLLDSAEDVISHLKQKNESGNLGQESEEIEEADVQLIETAFSHYKRLFDSRNGGFGRAPKFPTPHNLLFLMRYFEKCGKKEALNMVEKTLIQMYRGGIFDHIGGGFSRYSTDEYFLVPHFEKMLYDNALLIMAYCKAYQLTGKSIYYVAAKKTADYVLREMTSKEGGFYSAQDADSEGIEGKYYLFEPKEIFQICGEEEGKRFNQYFDITDKGNFEGKNILNLLKQSEFDEWNIKNKSEQLKENDLFVSNRSLQEFDECKKKLYEYRKKRYRLHLDDKILTSWNGLMISAMCCLYRVSGDRSYLEAAIKAQSFIEKNLWDRNTVFVSFREGKRSEKGFLDDYANEVLALIHLYEATFHKDYLEKAKQFCEKALENFYDKEQGGFFLYGEENEALILRPKETYDGAVFSGNSAMAYNLVQLFYLTGEDKYSEMAEKQLKFLANEARDYPSGHAMFLIALLDYDNAPDKVTIVVKEKKDLEELKCRVPLDMVIHIVEIPAKDYPLLNDRTTFYVCKGHSCLPAMNELKLFQFLSSY